MNDPYEEILEGELCLRLPPTARHELIGERLHRLVAASLAHSTVARLLPARTLLKLAPDCEIRPDLTVVTVAGSKPLLVVEIVNSGDHHADTVIKKLIYEAAAIPRLWMVDPRYDNVETYHGGTQGLILKTILANRELLEEPLLPGFQIKIADLFAPAS